jgi:hypothetical protein
LTTLRQRRVLGSVLIALVPVLLVALVLTPGVRGPLGRCLSTIGADGFGGDEGDVRLPLDRTKGITAGHPVFLGGVERGLRPVAWVVGVEEHAVRLRFAPGEPVEGPWRLVALQASSGLGEALTVAVPPAVADDLGGRLYARLERLLQEAVLPEIEKHLPAFFSRVDPRTDPRAREVFDAVGATVLERLQPFADEVGDVVTRDLEAHFDLLDRMGILWKVVRGDAKGLAEQLLPVAEKSVKTWWAGNRDEVLGAVGEAIVDEAPRWQAWLTGEVWDAAKEEIAGPVLEAQKERIEAEAEEAIREVLDVVVSAPGGGFRTRFAAVLRSQLLNKDEPLLLIERRDGAGPEDAR